MRCIRVENFGELSPLPVREQPDPRTDHEQCIGGVLLAVVSNRHDGHVRFELGVFF